MFTASGSLECMYTLPKNERAHLHSFYDVHDAVGEHTLLATPEALYVTQTYPGHAHQSDDPNHPARTILRLGLSNTNGVG